MVRVLFVALATMLLTAHVSAIAASPIRQLTSSTATNVRPAWSPTVRASRSRATATARTTST
jgi:hypothetical protein